MKPRHRFPSHGGLPMSPAYRAAWYPAARIAAAGTDGESSSVLVVMAAQTDEESRAPPAPASRRPMRRLRDDTGEEFDTQAGREASHSAKILEDSGFGVSFVHYKPQNPP